MSEKGKKKIKMIPKEATFDRVCPRSTFVCSKGLFSTQSRRFAYLLSLLNIYDSFSFDPNTLFPSRTFTG